MEYKTLELKDETGKNFTIYPTNIAQVLGKLERAKEYIQRGEIEIALNFIENAKNAADGIIFEKIEDDDPENWSGIRFEKIDYNSFWLEDDRRAEI